MGSTMTTKSTETLTKEIYEHHMRQHRGALASSLATHGKNAVFMIHVRGATSAGGVVTSKGGAIFQGPLDVLKYSNESHSQLRTLLGEKLFSEFVRFVENISSPASGALVITMVELDGNLLTSLSNEAC